MSGRHPWPPPSDRLSEIEERLRRGGYGMLQTREIEWLIAEVKQLRKDLETMWEDNDYYRAVVKQLRIRLAECGGALAAHDPGLLDTRADVGRVPSDTDHD